MARRIPFLGTTHRLKVVVTILTGIVVLAASHQVLLPPNLVPVAVLKAAVPAQGAIPASDVVWMRVDAPPPTVLTQAQASLLNGQVVSQALPAGATIPVADLTAPTLTTQLRSGEVPWIVNVSGPLATYYTLGGRVSVWASPAQGSAPTEIAAGVRIVALNNSQGQPVTPTAGQASTAPSSVTLAVPLADLQTLLALTSVTLEPDSPQTHFLLMTGGGSGSLFGAGAPPTSGTGSSSPSGTPAATGTGSAAKPGSSHRTTRPASSTTGASTPKAGTSHHVSSSTQPSTKGRRS